MARLFLALTLPERLQDRLGEEIDRLRLSGAAVAWVAPRKLHLTLRFLGEMDPGRLLTLDPLIREACAGTGALRLLARGLGAFPDASRPRVVWCGVEGEDPDVAERLQDLHRRIERAARSEGFRPEKGGFEPHVTLGRVKSPLNVSSLLERMGPAVRREFGRFEATKLVLLESHLRASGSSYEEVQEFAL